MRIVCFYIECENQMDLELTLRHAGFAFFDATDRNQYTRDQSKFPDIESIEAHSVETWTVDMKTGQRSLLPEGTRGALGATTTHSPESLELMREEAQFDRAMARKVADVEEGLE